MKRSLRIAAATICAMGTLLAVEGPAQNPQPVKPLWKRMLQGADAKKAAEQEKRLSELQEAGQFAEALKVAEALAELRAKSQGADHWEAVNARFEVEALRQVLRAKKEEQQSYCQAFALNRKAYALKAKGHYLEAQPLYGQVLSIRRKVLGEEHPDTALSYYNLAHNLEDQGKYKEAEESSRKALAIYRKVLGEEYPETANALAQLGGLLLKQKKFTDAEPLLRQCLSIREKKQPDMWTTFNARSLLGEALLAQKKYAEAEPLLVKGYEGMKERQDKIPPAYRQVRLSEALERLVRLYEATEQKEKADYWRRKLNAEKPAKGDGNPKKDNPKKG